MKRRFLPAVLALALAAPVASAPAATHRHAPPTVKTVLRDCKAHGKLTKRYSLALLKRAKRQMPADVRNYSNCSQVLSKAIKKEQRRQRNRHHGRR
jgi:hypothetical protein